MSLEQRAATPDATAPYPLRVAAIGIRLTADEPLTLPDHPGSTLRGAFGHALLAVGCMQRAGGAACLAVGGDTDGPRDGPRCRENAEAVREGRASRCAYGFLFETPPPPHRPRRDSQVPLPHPYVLRPPAGRTYQPGEGLELRVHLLGSAIRYLPAVIEAASLLGHRGLGSGRATSTVRDVWELSPLGADVRPLPPGAGPAALVLTAGWDEAIAIARTLPPRALAVRFLTPTHLVRDRTPLQRPEFGELMRALFRRMSLLQVACGDGSSSAPFAAPLAGTGGVRLAGWDGGWDGWDRYSSRQDRHLRVDGLVGTAHYEGDLAPFLPYLVLGQALHVGKACTFGEGQYVLGSG